MKNVSVWVILSFISLGLVACKPHDEQYFKVHPKALQAAIAECPSRAPKLVTCAQLQNIAVKVNDYVYELRMSPQGFGKKILSLQELMVKQPLAQQEALNVELRERLSVVDWLESPSS